MCNTLCNSLCISGLLSWLNDFSDLRVILMRCESKRKASQIDKKSVKGKKKKKSEIGNFAAATLIHYSHQVRNGPAKKRICPQGQLATLQHTFSNIAALNSAAKRGKISKFYQQYVTLC